MTDFVHTRTIDPATGKSRLRILLDGVECSSVPLTSRRTRSYLGFSLISKDLGDALACLREAHSLIPRPVGPVESGPAVDYREAEGGVRLALKAHFFAAVVLYGRCFVSAEGRGTKLDAAKHVPKELQPAHEKVMGFRHRLVAHAGDLFDDGEAIVAVPPSGPRFHVAANLWRLDFEDDRSADTNFESLITRVKASVDAKVLSLQDKLIAGEGRELAIELQGRR